MTSMLTLSRRRVCGLLVAGSAVAIVPPAVAADAKTAREQYLKAAKALARLVKVPPERLPKEDIPAFEELQKVLAGTAAMLNEAADKVGDGDDELVARVQEQLAATNDWLGRYAKMVSNLLTKIAAAAQAIINNLK
jgi:hypothetical protein